LLTPVQVVAESTASFPEARYLSFRAETIPESIRPYYLPDESIRSASVTDDGASTPPTSSPFASLRVGGTTRFPWSLESKRPEKLAFNPRSTPDVSFRDLLEQRLAEAKVQLAAPGVTQSVRWYLETEIRRIEGKLADDEVVKPTTTLKSPEEYTQPFCDFLTENPTVFHTVDHFGKKLTDHGFKKVCASIPPWIRS
jgi:hypothetical protein